MKRAYKPLPTQERLHELFDYSVITGQLYHRHGRKKGRAVGFDRPTKSRYRQARIDGSSYLMHRLVWCWVTGVDPEHLDIDHADCDGNNNAWHNLRLATCVQNGANMQRQRRSYSGFKGVSRTWKPDKPWRARIRIEGEQIHLGVFDTPEDAHAAYCRASAELRGEFHRAA